MDRGTVHDNRGQELGFEGTLLAFTSNLGYGAEAWSREQIGYRGGATERERHLQAEAERTLHLDLPSEFLARLRTIRFSPLSPHSMNAILELEVAKVFRRFQELHGLEITLTPAARQQLLQIGFSEAQGARHLASVVRRYCNVEVGRRLREDRKAPRGDGGGAVRHIREIRKGERAFDRESVECEVLHHARVDLPYSRLVIDFCGGEFAYRGESE
jgi:ATP-dependent Clp protease ATP-binding subunit ClpA